MLINRGICCGRHCQLVFYALGPHNYLPHFFFVPGHYYLSLCKSYAARAANPRYFHVVANDFLCSNHRIFCRVFLARYGIVEKVASIMAGLLIVIVLVTSIRVFSSRGAFVQGLVPNVPQNLDMQFVMPWLGFILAGAAGNKG